MSSHKMNFMAAGPLGTGFVRETLNILVWNPHSEEKYSKPMLIKVPQKAEMSHVVRCTG